MKVRDKYIKIFGKIDSLAEPVSWATGISNMFEWLTWGTDHILGVTKTEYRKMLIAWTHEEANKGVTLEETIARVCRKADSEIMASEADSRTAKPKYSLATPREALRRAKYFSEEYLNREFDIFLSLASNRYLDSLFSQQTDIRGGGRWFSHGNSGLFSYSADIDEMQIDNLTYSPEEQLLVGVELKLGGRKNPDQIFKYCLLFRRLLDRQFVSPDARFCLLFIGDQLVGGKEEQPDWADLIENEIAYCRKSPKSTGRKLVDVNVLDISKKCTFCCTTWQKVWDLNEAYAHGLDLPAQEVEKKLIEGFNETLATKTFLDFRRG